jgi:hypothetical protein
MFLDHGDVTWDCPKGKVMGRRMEILRHMVWDCPKGKVMGRRMEILRYMVLEKKSCRYFVVKTHKFYFNIPQVFFFFVWILLQ